MEKRSSDEQNLGNSKEQSTLKVQDESASAAKNPSSQERIGEDISRLALALGGVCRELASSAVALPDSLLAEECEDVLASGLSDVQDPEGESFEKLFAKFAQMKGLLNYLNCSMSLGHCLQYQYLASNLAVLGSRLPIVVLQNK